MLAEIKDARQIMGEGFRRWFRDQDHDLIVWYEDESQQRMEGFQFCYNTRDLEHALTWTRSHGYQHHRVDEGDRPQAARMSPILVQDGVFDADYVCSVFKSVARDLDFGLVEIVSKKIAAAS